MTTYHNATIVEKHGKKLTSRHPPQQQPCFPENMELVMVLDNGSPIKVAVRVTKMESYHYFYNEYMAGQWLSADIYTYSP